MEKTKYGHMLKKLNFNKGTGRTKGTANADYFVWPKGKDLEGLNFNFSWGYYSKTGKWGSEEDSCHIHPSNECMVFVGLDYDNPNNLGAEIEIAMGQEGEKHVFSNPTNVIVPAGLPHCPLAIRKVTKPYGLLTISLAAEHKTTRLPENKQPSPTVEIGKLVKKLSLHDAQRKSGGNADFGSGWTGKNLKGYDLNFTWAFHTGLGDWHGDLDPHVHPAGEFLLFVGLDPENPGYLGAELTIGMGEEGETLVINTPAVVVVPAGLVHCPLITRKVNKPYGFSAISLNAEHQTTWLGKGRFNPPKFTPPPPDEE